MHLRRGRQLVEHLPVAGHAIGELDLGTRPVLADDGKTVPHGLLDLVSHGFDGRVPAVTFPGSDVIEIERQLIDPDPLVGDGDLVPDAGVLPRVLFAGCEDRRFEAYLLAVPELAGPPRLFRLDLDVFRIELRLAHDREVGCRLLGPALVPRFDRDLVGGLDPFEVCLPHEQDTDVQGRSRSPLRAARIDRRLIGAQSAGDVALPRQQEAEVEACLRRVDAMPAVDRQLVGSRRADRIVGVAESDTEVQRGLCPPFRMAGVDCQHIGAQSRPAYFRSPPAGRPGYRPRMAPSPDARNRLPADRPAPPRLGPPASSGPPQTRCARVQPSSRCPRTPRPSWPPARTPPRTAGPAPPRRTWCTG